jgi:hypothetical protein
MNPFNLSEFHDISSGWRCQKSLRRRRWRVTLTSASYFTLLLIYRNATAPAWVERLRNKSAAETAVTTSTHTSLAGAVIERIHAWVQHRRNIAELQDLDAGEFQRMARELGLAPGYLDQLVQQGPPDADELPLMMKALGFSQATIASINPRQLYDMQTCCGECEHKHTCNNDISAKIAAQNYQNYCANADTIAAMKQAAQ